MKSVTSRVQRLELLVARAACPVCRGRVRIVAFFEEAEPPRDVGCCCGRTAIIWRSQAPPELDEALDTALERSDDYSIPLPTRRP